MTSVDDSSVEGDGSPWVARLSGAVLGFAASAVGVSVKVGVSVYQGLVLLAVLTLIVTLMSRSSRQESPGRGAPVGTLLAAITYVVGSCVLEYLDSSQLRYSPDFSSPLGFAFVILGGVSAFGLVTSRRGLSDFCVGFVVASVPSSVIALTQSFAPSVNSLVTRVAPSDGLDSRITDDRLLRSTALVGHWTGYGLYGACVVAALAVVFCLRVRLSGTLTTTLVVVAALQLGALAVTFTFSVYLVVLLVVMVAAWVLRVRARVLAVSVVFAAAAYYTLSTQVLDRLTQQTVSISSSGLPSWVPNTLQFRFQVWTDQTLPAIAGRPLMGWGQGVYGNASVVRNLPPGLVWGSSESQWLGSMVSSGAVGTLLLLVAVVSPLWWMVRRARLGSPFAYLVPVVALHVAVMATSVTVSAFTNRGFPLAFAVLFGACAGAVREYREPAEPPEPVEGRHRHSPLPAASAVGRARSGLSSPATPRP